MPATGHLNISPTLFHGYAIQYLQCERRFTTDANYSPVPYFLLCRAIELVLKAKHLESKSRAEVKKQYGHNLKKSYDELLSTDKTLDSIEYTVLLHASKIYDDPNKGFEYVTVGDAVTGLKGFPDITVLKDIAAKLVDQ
jgi:hypothetical protein